MLHWAFLSLMAMAGAQDFVQPESAISRTGDTFVRFHSMVDVQLFCELKWGYEDEFFWLRPRGASEWVRLEPPYQITCGSFVDEDGGDIADGDGPDGVQLRGTDITEGGGSL